MPYLHQINPSSQTRLRVADILELQALPAPLLRLVVQYGEELRGEPSALIDRLNALQREHITLLNENQELKQRVEAGAQLVAQLRAYADKQFLEHRALLDEFKALVQEAQQEAAAAAAPPAKPPAKPSLVRRWFARAASFLLLVFAVSGCGVWNTWKRFNPGSTPEPRFPITYESRAVATPKHLLVLEQDLSYRLYKGSQLIDAGSWTYEPLLRTWCPALNRCLHVTDNWMQDPGSVFVPGISWWRESPTAYLWPPPY